MPKTQEFQGLVSQNKELLETCDYNKSNGSLLGNTLLRKELAQPRLFYSSKGPATQKACPYVLICTT